MNIISIDLPWKEGKRGRRALAVADLDRNIKIMSASDDDEMLEQVRDNAEPKSRILLDVPIEGCQNLRNFKGKRFRPVDIALAHQRIGIFPSYRARNRGKVLKERIQNTSWGRKVTVQEIYPYAVYKFLAYLKDRKLLGCLKPDKFDTLLDGGFRTYLPPKYKRERKKEERRKNMEYLYSLLMDTALNFRIPLHYPDASANLGPLSDEYDACLGAIVGVYLAGNSSYACVAGDSSSGNILLLADRWLAGELGKEVKLSNLRRES